MPTLPTFARAADRARFLQLADKTTWDDAGKRNLLKSLPFAELDTPGDHVVSVREADQFFTLIASYRGPNDITDVSSGVRLSDYEGLDRHVDGRMGFLRELETARFADPADDARFRHLVFETTLDFAGQKALLRAAGLLDQLKVAGAISPYGARLFFHYAEQFAPGTAAGGSYSTWAGFPQFLSTEAHKNRDFDALRFSDLPQP